MNKLQEIAEGIATEEKQWIENNVLKLLTPRQKLIARLPIFRWLLRFTSGIMIVYIHQGNGKKIEIWQHDKKMFSRNKIYKGI